MSRLAKIPDASAVNGWAYLFRYAFDSAAPLRFRNLTWCGKAPTTGDGLTWRLLVKVDRADPDSSAIVDATSLTVNPDPLVVGYLLDTGAEGFARDGRFPGELWVNDPEFSKPQLLVEFIVDLSNPLRNGL